MYLVKLQEKVQITTINLLTHTFGKFKLATHQITQEKVAIKILEKSNIADASDIKRATREIQVLKKSDTQIQFNYMKNLKIAFSSDEIYQWWRNRLRDTEAAKLFAQLIQCQRIIKESKLFILDSLIYTKMMNYQKQLVGHTTGNDSWQKYNGLNSDIQSAGVAV